MSLESRVRQMNNDMIKIDLIVSEALELKRYERFVQKILTLKIDARRD